MPYEHNRYEGFSEKGLRTLIKGFRGHTSLKSLRFKFPKYNQIYAYLIMLSGTNMMRKEFEELKKTLKRLQSSLQELSLDFIG